MKNYLLKVSDTGQIHKIAQQIEGLDGKVVNILPITQVICFSIDPDLILAIKNLPGVSAVEDERTYEIQSYAPLSPGGEK
jgi:hypothetical protein